MAAPSAFALFPLLPDELKLKIYRMALPGRSVPVRLKLDLEAWNWSSERDWWTCYALVPDTDAPRTPLPALLGVRYEAWQELRNLYPPLQISRSVLAALLTSSKESGAGNEAMGDYGDADEVDEGIAMGPAPISLPAPISSLSISQSREIGSQPLPSLHTLLDSMLIPRHDGDEGKACLRRPSFHPDLDILCWRDTQRWASCGDAQLRTFVHPLFLAASLSVRYVSVDYVPSMAGLLEVLALSVLDTRRPLEGLELRVRNPSDCRLLRFRLCRVPGSIGGRAREIGPVLGEDGTEGVEEVIRQQGEKGVVFFPWFRETISRRRRQYDRVSRPEGEKHEPLIHKALTSVASQAQAQAPSGAAAPAFEHPLPSPLPSLLAHARLETSDVAILQVVSHADPMTAPGASGTAARRRALADPAAVRFQYAHSDVPLGFGSAGCLQTDVLLWTHALKLHGAGYPANLPFEIVGIPCHGFCGEDFGMGG
ncbi:uncharacterized protein JN550_005087 [Neoarthrinium moseri]|uniref:uncharacterized protein n=1 Tax=Neoarthrinium moseri TaxID=1658444 RepID=UPI001FDD107A|nr:uncharacterized protein JN550_005087 [Neoarthrinium moseri]KAI1870544.1 hypothetical protein JN550_005087 [Neoarthrinium moseri]